MANAAQFSSRCSCPSPVATIDMGSGDGEGDEGAEPGWLRRNLSVIIGVIGLFAWFAMLWFMFGDVL